MAIVKMKYGIDLGTTNSALCKLENGVCVIQKTDTLKETLPSCVSFTKKKIIKVGDNAYNDLRADKSRATKNWQNNNQNVFLEFKRTMGLDTQYYSSNMDKSFSSEMLSAEVLKTLLSFVNNEHVTSCVITIPAKFKTDQIAATMRAAKLAGLTQCELLQEPIAAATAYGITADDKNGNWLVFDFGGGTFDAALLNVQDGILQVKDTEGDNYLGGKNLDYALVDKILIPALEKEYNITKILQNDVTKEILRDGVKFYAEQAKNSLSFRESCDITSQLDEFGCDDDGEPIELDLVITQDQVKEIFAPFFQKAIDICNKLLQRNNLTGADITSLVLVGGPTHSPLLRAMLQEQITANINTNIDPMTAVAKGAAIYASTIDCEETVTTKDSNKPMLTLDVTYESSSVESVEYVTVRPLLEESQGDFANINIELVRGDKAWSSGMVPVDATGEVIECQLVESKPNSFTINAYNNGVLVDCFPKDFTIIQGTKLGSAVLPYFIGIEATNIQQSSTVFVALKGLEKNATLPAVGIKNGLKTPKTLRIGNSSDRLVIPVYQGEFGSDYTSTLYNDHVFDVVITGEDIPETVSANSDVDITIRIDRSQMMTLEATFPSIGETIEKPIEVNQRPTVDVKDILSLQDKAEDQWSTLNDTKSITKDEIASARKMLDDVENNFKGEINSDDGKMHLMADLRRACLEMGKVEKVHEWESLETALRTKLDALKFANETENSEYSEEVDNLSSQVDLALAQKNIQFARMTVDALSKLFIRITILYQVIHFIRNNHEYFNPEEWKDSARARQLLNILYPKTFEHSVSMDSFHPHIIELFQLSNTGFDERVRLV